MTRNENNKQRERLRILFVSDHLGHEGGRIHGATRYFLDVLPRLHQIPSISVHVVFLREPHHCAEELRARGVHPIFLSRKKHDPRTIHDLIKYIKEHQIQIVHCAGMKGILSGRIAARLTGIACIDHFHDMIPPAASIATLLRVTRSFSSHTIAISEAVSTFVQSTFRITREKICCIHNGIETGTFSKPVPKADQEKERSSLGIPESATILICVGRLHPLKGQADAIRAVQLLNDSSVWLILVGDGPDLNHLQESAQKMQVIFTGQRTDIPNLLSIASLMLAPSKSEGLGLGAMEALCAGVPVLAYNQGGLSEIIEHGTNGLLIPTGNIHQLSRSIRQLLEDPEKQTKMSKQAKEKAQTYSLDHHIEKLVQLYQSVNTMHHPEDSQPPTSVLEGDTA